MGVYIKGITIEMLRNAPLEAVEDLLAEGDMVEVPEPHGRLIDADEIITQMNEMKVEGETFTTAVNYVKLINEDAPTVIEAQDEQGDTISRQAAIDVAVKHGTFRTKTNRQGKWIIRNVIDRRGRPTGDKTCTCDLCKKTITIKWGEEIPQFCGFCKARME